MKRYLLYTLKLIKITIITIFVCFCINSKAFCQIQNSNIPNIKKGTLSYCDTIYLSLYKTAFLEIKGRETKSVNIGQQSEDIEIGQQDTLPITMLKVLKENFQETNLTVFLEDTTLQFLVIYSNNPARNYYSYTIPKIETKTRVLKGETSNAKEETTNSKTDFEKNAAQLINPRNKLFSQIRSKNQNANYGDYHKGVRIFVEKLYRSGQQTFIMIKVVNLSMSEFQIENLTAQKINGQDQKQIQIINEEAAYNNLKRGEKIEFVVLPDLIDLELNESLLFKLKSTDRKDNTFTLVISAKDFKKRESL